jgi:hypothetical protein
MSTDMTDVRFTQHRYLVRKKLLTLFGSKFFVLDESGNVVLYSRVKKFKLKEDIRLYTGEDMQHELMSIRARSIIDFGATYDVFDSQTGERIGALRRKGMKSILKDEWLILDRADHEIGKIKEDSLLMAMVRRVLTSLVPQTFEVALGANPVAKFKQHFNPFVLKMTLDFAADADFILDRRLGIAAAILLCAIEGRQS